jgi:diaminohydroxyphosphoribosylaminopyrimidine deaminase/5-amino-6-(5-phosphoribosylamino)uracil reductase
VSTDIRMTDRSRDREAAAGTDLPGRSTDVSHRSAHVSRHGAPGAEADVRWMRRALEHARRGLGRTTPNPVVGACIVSSDGVVVGQGAHERAGEPHAEVHALDEAGAAARGGTLYCTLEPCVHLGRTGPCTDRIIAAGIRRVVAAMEDPYPQVSGRGVAALRAHGIDVDVGLCADEAARLNQPFLTSIRERRPFVIVKAATSLDGYIAAGPGRRTAITSPAALRHAQYQRAIVDAIAVGSETVLVDDPLLTSRAVFRERPLVRVVFDRRLRVPPEARLFGTCGDGPVIILTSPEQIVSNPARVDALERAGATVVGSGDLHDALTRLAERDVQSLLVEGGGRLHAALWDADVVDYLQLYIAPVWIGGAGVPAFGGFAPPAAAADRC